MPVVVCLLFPCHVWAAYIKTNTQMSNIVTLYKNMPSKRSYDRNVLNKVQLTLKGTHEIIQKRKSSITNNHMRKCDSGPREIGWWGQVQFLFEQHGTKFALLKDSSIAFSPVSSHINHGESISGVAGGQEDNGVCALAVKIVATSWRRCLDVNMLSVYAANTVRKVPQAPKISCDSFPLRHITARDYSGCFDFQSALQTSKTMEDTVHDTSLLLAATVCWLIIIIAGSFLETV